MKKVEKANRIKGILFALPFAVMQLIGKDLSADNKINDLALGKFYIMRALILFTGYFVVAYVLSVLGFYIIEKLREKVAANKENTVERIGGTKHLRVVKFQRVVVQMKHNMENAVCGIIFVFEGEIDGMIV